MFKIISTFLASLQILWGFPVEVSSSIIGTHPQQLQTETASLNLINPQPHEPQNSLRGPIRVATEDNKGRVTFSEEASWFNGTNGKKLYENYSLLKDVKYDTGGNMISFHREASEHGLGTKGFAMTSDRVGEVDAQGRLSHYTERETSKSDGVKTKTTYEGNPEYDAAGKMKDEHREITDQEISRSFGFTQILGTVITAFAIGIVPAVLNLVSALDPNGIMGRIAGIASSVIMTVAGSAIAGPLGAAVMSSLNSISQGMISGQDFSTILKGAAINFGVTLVTAGVAHGVESMMGATTQTFAQAMTAPAFTQAAAQAAGTTITGLAAQSAMKQIFTRTLLTFAGDKLGVVGSNIVGGVITGALTGDPTQIVLGAIKGTASGYINQSLGDSVGAQFIGAAISGVTDTVIQVAGTKIVNDIKTGLDRFKHNWTARSQIPDGATAVTNGKGYIIGYETETQNGTAKYIYNIETKTYSDEPLYIKRDDATLTTGIAITESSMAIASLNPMTVIVTGSTRHNNEIGATETYDRMGNLIEAIPDNQIAIRDASGTLIATKLPISMMTMGMGQDILFSPLTPSSEPPSLVQRGAGGVSLEGGVMLGQVPMGAEPIISDGKFSGSYTLDTAGNETLYRMDGTKEAYLGRDGSLISYDSRGEIAYTLAPDGSATFPYYDANDIRSTLPAGVQVTSDELGNFSYSGVSSPFVRGSQEGVETLGTNYYNDLGQWQAFVPEGAIAQRDEQNNIIGSIQTNENGNSAQLDRRGQLLNEITRDGETRIYGAFDEINPENIIPAGANILLDQNGDLKESYKIDNAIKGIIFYDPLGNETGRIAAGPLLNELNETWQATVDTFRDVFDAKIRTMELLVEAENEEIASSLINDINGIKDLYRKEQIKNFFSLTTSAEAGENDMHYWSEYYLAREAGIPEKQARSIATIVQYVDDHKDSEPIFTSSENRKAYHFVAPFHDPVQRDNAIINATLDYFLEKGDIIGYSIAKHAYGDSWTHENFNAAWDSTINRRVDDPWPDMGHLDSGYGGHAVDLPFLAPEKFLDASKAMYNQYRKLAEKSGWTAVHEWSEIEGNVLETWQYRGSAVDEKSYNHDKNLEEREENWKSFIKDRGFTPLEYTPESVVSKDYFEKKAIEYRDFVQGSLAQTELERIHTAASVPLGMGFPFSPYYEPNQDRDLYDIYTRYAQSLRSDEN